MSYVNGIDCLFWSGEKMSNELAISAIQEHASEQKLDKTEQLVLTCEFITTLDKDTDFKQFLIKQSSQRNKNN